MAPVTLTVARTHVHVTFANPYLTCDPLSADEVSMAHFMSCGEDALIDREAADRVADAIVAAVERRL